jgi:Domain of unknown function (DUF4167)
MRSGPDQRPRGRFNGSRPYQQQPRVTQNNQSFDSNGSGVRIRGNAFQIYERYLALAREAATSDDRIAAENFYQHAEYYFRINGASREARQQGVSPQPTRPDDDEVRSSRTDSSEAPQTRQASDDPVFSGTATS